jgi:hypothetical protein
MNNVVGLGGPARNPAGGGGGGDAGGTSGCAEKVTQWWSTVPLFNRFIFYSSIGIYLISFIIPQVLSYTLNIPPYVIWKFQIWRVITAPFANIQIFMLVFGL